MDNNDNLVKIIKSGADYNGENMLALYNGTVNLLFYLSKGSTPGTEEDLKQEFFLWLSDAVNMFDEQKGVKFISFLTARLKENLKTYYAENKTGVYCPRGRLAYLNKYERERRKLADILGREPTDKQMCAFMKIKPRDLEQIKKDLQAIGTAQSLNEENEDGQTLADALADPFDFEEDITERLARQKAYEPLWRAVCSESGLDKETVTKYICVEYRGKFDATRAQLQKALRKIKHAPAKYGAIQKALEYQGVNFCRHKSVRAFQNDGSSVVEDLVIKELERREK